MKTASATAHAFPKQISPAQLPTLLAQFPHINILSLDCFDTIVWRKTEKPMDVFFDLQNSSAFKAAGISAQMRVNAEVSARKLKCVSKNSTEVSLEEIFRSYSSDLTDEQIAALIEAELAAEMQTLYAFPPVIDLMRQAHAAGIKMIIVSDTYLNEKQLRRLLEHCLPTDVMENIHTIFCSSQYGKSKPDGLFTMVTDAIHRKGNAILHIGDNPLADYIAPHKIGLHAIQLNHFDESIAEILRLQALAGNYLDPHVRNERSLPNPFRGVLSANQVSMDKAETAIGYAAVGSIFYAFGKFILDDLEEMSRQGKKPTLLFLMRDGHLPALICEALAGREVGHRVCISRFTAIAASFRSGADVDKYLAEAASSLRFADICRQLLLPDAIAQEITAKAVSKGDDSEIEFLRQIHDDAIQKIIIEKSTAFRSRLKKHLVKQANIAPGDTVVFVDLGYTGTAQMLLEPILRDEMNIEIIGRYLIALHTPEWQRSRRGLLDPSWCDSRTLLTLVYYIALLEQISTSNDKSAVDFDEEGNPLFSSTALSKGQHNKLVPIQQECIRFAKEAKAFFALAKTDVSLTTLRDTAMAALGRLIFFPTEMELKHLQSFEFDLNLGTKDILKVFDAAAGLEGLRKRGLFFMERNAQTMRTNYPAELRTAGIELSMLLLAQHRFGLEIRMQDLSFLRENINIILMRGNDVTQSTMVASPTHDGYYALQIPAGNGSFHIGIQFGLNYQWVQLESAELIRAQALFSQSESQHTQDVASNLIVDHMLDRGGGLFECTELSGLLMFVPPKDLEDVNYVYRLVFRPIVKREQSAPLL